MDTKLIAFHLPQYHPIPENDLWWGKGFTEWTNVVKAKPLFPGHYQPHLPADLGFYDLRLPEARAAQAELAGDYGIHGFCYYHYWFNGKQLLERPVNDIIASGEPDFPFCLCWANENWTRIWDGQDKQVLIGQNYSEDDDRLHIRWLISAFQDKRYIRIQNKPLFLVYRAGRLPNPLRTSQIWREEAQQLGIGEIYLCRVESFSDEYNDAATIGFDACVEFQPQAREGAAPLRIEKKSWIESTLRRKQQRELEDIYERNTVWDYVAFAEAAMRQKSPSYKRFPCVTPSWDNSARRTTGANIFINSSPDAYECWLRSVIENLSTVNSEPRLVFINAWNEWAEGNHLEPCQKWGRGYLEATRNALLGTSAK